MSALAILVAAAGILDATGYLSPEAFAFVKPGVSRAEVDKRLGEPWVSSPSVVAKGQIDLFVDSLHVERGEGGGPRETEDVHYYEYRPPEHSSQFARIVFRGRRVWYAQLPPPVSERTPAELDSRYGRVFEVNTRKGTTGHLPWRYTLHRNAEMGLAFLERGGRITHRIVFPPEKKLPSP